MSEPIVTQQPPIVEPIEDAATQLAKLRPIHEEVLAKASARKVKIVEHESTIAALQGQLSTANETIKEVTIGGPLKAMAASISISPELWLEQFAKSHRLEIVKGQLTVLTADGKQVPFEREALIAHLNADAHPQSKVFKSITIVNRASGAAGVTGFPGGKITTTPAKFHFGLK
jgi:hypothetical protein